MTKVTSLSNAVRAAVKPGDTLVFAFTHNRSHAAAFEVARQFRDKRCLQPRCHRPARIRIDPVRRRARLRSSNRRLPAPPIRRRRRRASCRTPSPSSRKAIRDWTNLTMTLRLMAGAMGWPFVPTNSLAGSGLWREQNRRHDRRSVHRQADAGDFGAQSGRRVPACRPSPTRTAMRSCMAPTPRKCWGVLARQARRRHRRARVSPEEFRAIGPRTGIPGSSVAHVVLAPFGAHPQGQFVWSAEEGVSSYAEDYDFRLMLRALWRDPKALRAWVEDWVFGTDHDSYHRAARPRTAG